MVRRFASPTAEAMGHPAHKPDLTLQFTPRQFPGRTGLVFNRWKTQVTNLCHSIGIGSNVRGGE